MLSPLNSNEVIVQDCGGHCLVVDLENKQDCTLPMALGERLTVLVVNLEQRTCHGNDPAGAFINCDFNYPLLIPR